MAKYVYRDAERFNQLTYEFNTPDNIVAVIDSGHTLTIYTKDVTAAAKKQ